MKKWLYYGTREVRSNGQVVTIPPPIFKKNKLPDGENKHVFWYYDEDIQAFFILDHHTPEVACDSVEGLYTNINVKHGTRNVHFLEEIYGESHYSEDAKPKANDPVAFLSGKAENTEDRIYLLKKSRLECLISKDYDWVNTRGNLARLLRDGILKVDDLPDIIRTSGEERLITYQDIRRRTNKMEQSPTLYEIPLPGNITIKEDGLLFLERRTNPDTLCEYLYIKRISDTEELVNSEIDTHKTAIRPRNSISLLIIASSIKDEFQTNFFNGGHIIEMKKSGEEDSELLIEEIRAFKSKEYSYELLQESKLI